MCVCVSPGASNTNCPFPAALSDTFCVPVLDVYTWVEMLLVMSGGLGAACRQNHEFFHMPDSSICFTPSLFSCIDLRVNEVRAVINPLRYVNIPCFSMEYLHSTKDLSAMA